MERKIHGAFLAPISAIEFFGDPFRNLPPVSPFLSLDAAKVTSRSRYSELPKAFLA